MENLILLTISTVVSGMLILVTLTEIFLLDFIHSRHEKELFKIRVFLRTRLIAIAVLIVIISIWTIQFTFLHDAKTGLVLIISGIEVLGSFIVWLTHPLFDKRFKTKES